MFKNGDKVKAVREITSQDIFGDDNYPEEAIAKWTRGTIQEAEGNYYEVKISDDKVAWGYNKCDGWELDNPIEKPETNYWTYLVMVWLDNNVDSQEFCIRAAEKCIDLSRLEKTIRDFVADNNPLEDESNLYADLIRRALREVDWNAVASYYWNSD